MMRRRVMFALLATAVLAGCGLTRPSVDVHTYLVVPGAPKANDATNALRLLVAPFDIDGLPLQRRAFPSGFL